MSSANQTKPQTFTCQECGATVTGREFHDYVECIRHRWGPGGTPRDGSEGHEARELAQAFQDISSLIAWIDANASDDRAKPQ